MYLLVFRKDFIMITVTLGVLLASCRTALSEHGKEFVQAWGLLYYSIENDLHLDDLSSN